MAKMTVTRSFNGNLDASFSTYLNLKPKDQSTTHHGAHLGCAVDDCEISIFDAQKYFNEGNNNNTDQDHDHQHELMKKETTKRFPLTSVRPVGGGGGGGGGITELPRFSSASSSVDTTYTNNRNSNYRGVGGARSFHHATPTASSEASWNSQTGLLSNPPGSMKVSLRNVPTTATTTAYNNIHEKKSRSSRSSWLFGRRRCPCPCIGEKSIQVQEEKLAEPPLKTPVRSDISSNTIKTHTTTLKPPVEKVAPPNKSDRGGLIGQEQEVSPRSLEVIANPPTKFSPENHFPVSQGHHHRIVATGRSFSDNAAAAAAGFSFPILNHQKLALNSMPLPGPPNHPGAEDPPRESLEVFRPYDDETTSRNSSLDLLQHRDRRSFTFPASPKSRMTTVTDDDVASDASSDLFEIESFSTQTTTTTCPVLYHRRDSLEDDETSASTFHLRRRLSAATIGGGGGGGGGGLYYPVTPSSIAPTECYEPSEASIDWSVTTAEGFDKGSLTNYSIANGLSSEVTDEDTIMHEQDQNNRRRGGGWNGLLSCRCKKSVGVGPNLMRSALNDQQQQHDHHQYHHQAAAAAAASSCTVLVKSSSNNKHVPSFTNKPPLATTTTTHSHSARLFLPFAT